MDSVTFQSVQTSEQLQAVSGLAQEIWTQHYLPIIGKPQVDYMLEHYQSPSALRRQIECENYTYYLLQVRGVNVGYIGVVAQERSLFLSKLYIKEKYRGKGLASQAIEFCTKLCREKHLEKIWLTVNRHNTGSIAVYRRLGFITTREQAADIGNGFVMDDYIMEKWIH